MLKHRVICIQYLNLQGLHVHASPHKKLIKELYLVLNLYRVTVVKTCLLKSQQLKMPSIQHFMPIF